MAGRATRPPGAGRRTRAAAPSLGPASRASDTSRRSNGGRARLTLGEAARIIREAVKDKSNRSTALGQLVGRYLRWFRNEYGATDSTLRDYEAVLARMSLTLADKEPIDVSVDDLRDVIDLWGERSPRTRQKVTSVVRAFWSWAEEQGHIAISPAARIRRPRAEKRVAPLLPADARPRLLTIAKHPATAWPCSACSYSESGEAGWPAFRSATSTPTVARFASTVRAARNGRSRSAGRYSPSSSSFSAATSPTSATARARRLPSLPDQEGLRRARARRRAEARYLRLPEEAREPASRTSLVVPGTPGRGPCRPRRHTRPEHAPGAPHVRHRASPRRGN